MGGNGMELLGAKLRKDENGLVHFFCPACQCSHHLAVEGPHAWGWNGDGDRPTFMPSIGHRYTMPMKDEDHAAWMADHSYKLPAPVNVYCHSFITDGRIRFEPDSTHPLAGQTVDLPDYPGEKSP